MTDESTHPLEGRDAVRAAVRDFYDDLPFNYHGGVTSSADAVRANPVGAAYPDLDALLSASRGTPVLELGCGAGWLSNTMAHSYGARVHAVDLCGRALDRARAVADELGVGPHVQFEERDLFTVDRRGSLVVSIGALHHTGDTEGAVRHAASLVEPGGRLYLGLYHAPGRRPFLEALQGCARDQGEEAALRMYAELDPARAADPTLLRSWFRDQVLHPHETQHTLAEVMDWVAPLGFELVSTSINRFQPFGAPEEVFALEDGYAERSRRALFVERRYFPGFFTALVQKPAT